VSTPSPAIAVSIKQAGRDERALAHARDRSIQSRHCERSEATQLRELWRMDCFASPGIGHESASAGLGHDCFSSNKYLWLWVPAAPGRRRWSGYECWSAANG